MTLRNLLLFALAAVLVASHGAFAQAPASTELLGLPTGRLQPMAAGLDFVIFVDVDASARDGDDVNARTLMIFDARGETVVSRFHVSCKAKTWKGLANEIYDLGGNLKRADSIRSDEPVEPGSNPELIWRVYCNGSQLSPQNEVRGLEAAKAAAAQIMKSVPRPQ